MTQTPAPTVADIVRDLETTYPPSWARDWDRVGLTCGELDAPVRRVLLAVDPVTTVIDEALEWKADMLLTHHPLLLRGAHSVATTSAKGRALHRLIKGDCALFTAHTNADVATPGVSDALARIIGLENLHPLSSDRPDRMFKVVTTVPSAVTQPLIDAMTKAGGGSIGNYSRCAFVSSGTGTFTPQAGSNPHLGSQDQREDVAEERVEILVPQENLAQVKSAISVTHPYETPVVDVYELHDWPAARGIGRVGMLSRPTTLREFAMNVAQALPGTTQGIMVSGDPTAIVQRIAVCGGAGDSLFDEVRASGADVYVTSDLRHHPASEAREEADQTGPYLIDVAHWASEWPWLNAVANRLQGQMESAGTPIEVRVSARCTDPWLLRIPSPSGIVR